ncbi:Ribosome-binding protein 1, putative [Babesia ovata]|uniref:Ribosome-binding protein 1, putative n=1 Tax=Babesia ovata TaxID=189622 RepID=A0A2H6KK70_9APIC|nr:Ribosome-binding protein 1, putative [Babesia ovata]GBE63380.1 Ribosome-binding protein 1, putative [Babesia ovata]
MATAIKLDTLKECLQFLEWLHKDKKNGVKTKVATQLSNRLTGKYNNVDHQQIQQALSQFLTNVSKFHNKLCNKANQKQIGSNPNAVLDALLECIPKFLAAMYFLRYNVDPGFSKLDGGGWQNYEPVGTSRIMARQLEKYLTAPLGSKEYGVIPGGFSYNELKGGRYGYRQGSDMANHLEQICEKRDGQYFRDVFSTSVLLPTSGAQESNTANALALVRTFCGIVAEEAKKGTGGGQLISKLNEHFHEDKRICWNNLKEHCAELQKQFSKIFTSQRFSFTGFGREVKDLKEEEFAKETAKWLRDNLATVKTNLVKIKIDETTMKNTADYFTKNLFPYGFTFDRYNFGSGMTPRTILNDNWRSVINELRKPSDGLHKLKTILEGQECPPEKKDDEKESDKEAEGTSNQGKKTEGTPNQGKKSEGAQNQGKKSEGAQNQGKKSEGAQNQGKKTEPSPDQNNGQSEENLPM